jgi:N-acetylated-alpha-linked acidic dipeptidase
VPSPQGGTVYDAWKKASQPNPDNYRPQETSTYRPPPHAAQSDVPVGDLGSGSDYTVFIQHLGVPSTDISSNGEYGVYHSAFDDFNWFKKFGDPDFTYEQEMARIFGLEVLRMSSADVLPYDYETYGKEILVYLDAARGKSKERFGDKSPDFAAAFDNARRLQDVGAKMLQKQRKMPGAPDRMNAKLRDAERALLIPEGLPNRPWFRHAIYAPGQYTGYAAVVIPGVNEAIDRGDLHRTEQQIAALAAALNRAVLVLEQ